MKKNFWKMITLSSFALLGVDGIVYFGVLPKVLQTSVIAVETQEIKIGVPNLVPAVNTLVNRNGATVFYGYKSGDVPTEELLRLAHERRTKNNISKGLGVPRQRTTNYRPSQYSSQARNGESLHPSAPEKSGVQRVATTLEQQRVVGFKKQVKEKSSKKTRVSLVSSMRAYGTANTLKNARTKTEARQKWNSNVWAQNRKQEDNPVLNKNRSKIQVNVKDSRKNILEYYQEMEEFYSSPTPVPVPSTTNSAEPTESGNE